jgi:polar amino acid transport system ATP-binding protein
MADTLKAASSTVTERPMLAVDEISKRFGTLEVLRGVSLSVAAGEVVVVIGPSGSGKTTLLRCINLLEDYEQGTVTIDGDPIGYRLDRQTGQRVRMSEREIAAARESAWCSRVSICFPT